MPHDPTAIRNVALVGHHGAGKTTLAEALLAATGAIARRGSVEKGSTVMDFEAEEVARQLSISTSLAPFTVNGVKVNLLDTPGLRRLRRRDGHGPRQRRPGRRGGQRHRRRPGADRGHLARRGPPRSATPDRHQQARPGAGGLRPHAGRDQVHLRRRRGAGGAAHRARGRLPRCDRPARRHRDPLRHPGRRLGGRRDHPAARPRGPHPRGPRRRGAHRPRAARRGHRRGRRRSHGALSRGRDARLRGAREEPGRRRRLGERLPGAVLLCRQRCGGRPPRPPDRGAVPQPRLPAAADGHRGDRDGRDPLRPGGPDGPDRDQDLQRQPHRQDVPLQGRLGHPAARRRPRQLAHQGGGAAARAPEHRRARHRTGHQRRGGRLRRRAPAERDTHGRHPRAQGAARRGAAARAAPAGAASGGEARHAGPTTTSSCRGCSASATRTRR